MFGFSFTKLLILAAVIGAVWYGFRYLNRLQDQRSAKPVERRETKEPKPTKAEEMVQCPVCQAYVPEGSATNCGREACPY